MEEDIRSKKTTQLVGMHFMVLDLWLRKLARQLASLADFLARVKTEKDWTPIIPPGTLRLVCVFIMGYVIMSLGYYVACYNNVSLAGRWYVFESYGLRHLAICKGYF